MAIDLLANPTATAPTALADYQAILTQLVANGQAFTGRLIVQGSNIKAGTVILIGGVLYKATTDTAITGTASSYVKITPSGATASAAFVANLTGVTWNDAYGGYYDGSGNLHVFDEGLAVHSGAIAGAKTEIGVSSIANEVKGGTILTGSGNWVCPSNVYYVRVTMGGGGGGGGGGGDYTGGAGSGAGGGGGGAGGLLISTVSVVPGTTYAYVNGAGGAGGALQTTGTAGSASTFNGLSANGGAGGGGGIGQNPGTGGGAGAGGAGGGYFPISGSNGVAGGGNGSFGAGGVANVHGMAKIGVVGAGSGGAGGGGDASGTSGVTSPGILLEW